MANSVQSSHVSVYAKFRLSCASDITFERSSNEALFCQYCKSMQTLLGAEQTNVGAKFHHQHRGSRRNLGWRPSGRHAGRPAGGWDHVQPVEPRLQGVEWLNTLYTHARTIVSPHTRPPLMSACFMKKMCLMLLQLPGGHCQGKQRPIED